MRRAGFAAFVLAVSGCVVTDDGGPEAGLATAMDVKDAAAGVARAWDVDADLWSVFGLEPADAAAARASSDEVPSWALALMAEDDPQVGDGRAQAWAFVFADGTRRDAAYLVVVRADGEVVHSDEVAGDEDLPEGEGAIVMGDWRVDSDEAAAIVAEHNANWTRVARGPNATAFEVLAQEEDEDPHWVLWVDGGDGEDAAFGVVNARNGSYVEFDFDFGPFLTPAEFGSFDGTLTALEPEAMHAFDIEMEGHGTLLLKFIANQPATPWEVNLHVAGPDGFETTTQLQGGPSAGRQEHPFELPQPGVGEWTVTVRLDAGVALRYEMTWCATGFYVPTPFPGAGDPCT